MKTEAEPVKPVPEEYPSDYLKNRKADLSEAVMRRRLRHCVYTLEKRGPDTNEDGVKLLQRTIFDTYCLLRDMGVDREELNIAAGNKSPLASPQEPEDIPTQTFRG